MCTIISKSSKGNDQFIQECDSRLRRQNDRISEPSNWENMNTSIWVNYNDLSATSLGIMVSKGNHPQVALIQVSELL